MPYVNFDNETLQIHSIGDQCGISSIEIDDDTFKKIMLGSIPDLYIVRHPKTKKCYLSDTNFCNWFKWMNHDSEITETGFLIKTSANAGTRIIISKRGDGNKVYSVITIKEDAAEYIEVPFENPSLDTIDIFMSEDYGDEKI